ncbi:MAG: SPOR domain-containing protein [Pseudomonadota bacterium]|nr:SPOR domain-containing protein [Pseudomonadota bacterium]
MFARMLLVWLLIMNLGVAAWWVLQRPPPKPASAPQASGVPSLRLRDEGAQLSEASDEALDDAIAPAPAVAVAEILPPPLAAVEPPAAVPPAAPVCVSFGPFADEAAATTAGSRLAGPDIRTDLRRVESRAAGRGYNVVLPPQADRDAALAMAEQLRAAGFRDLIVINQGDNANGIALGRFGREENANRHQQALQAKGFPARVEPVGGAGGDAQFWLDVRANSGFDPAAAQRTIAAPGRQTRPC